MGFNDETIFLILYGYSLYYPKTLSRLSGIDKPVMNLMRQLFDNGFRTEEFWKLLKEIHTKHCSKMLHRKHEVMQRENSMINDKFDSGCFS